jgi:peptidoglycan/LPS O-acetylase OafA/YrhL
MNLPTAEGILRRHMPELDTLRGIAILLVLLYHGFSPQPDVRGFSGAARIFLEFAAIGWTGVGCFFVLSGFLITGILLDSKDRPDFFRQFYIRRALRILPLYGGVLLVLVVLTSTHWLLETASWRFLGLSVLFLSNFATVVRIPVAYGVLWSLAVEEHFYLAWPAVVRCLSRHGLAVAAVGICIVSPALRGGSFALGRGLGWTDYGAYTWLVADSLATGSFLAAILRSPAASRETAWRVVAVAFGASALFVVAGGPFGILSRATMLGMTFRQTALNLFFLGFLSLFLLLGSSRWKTWVYVPPLQFLGEISYGVYLIHTIIFWAVDRLGQRFLPQLVMAADDRLGWMGLRFCAALSGTLIIAYFSRWYFEEPFLRLKRITEQPGHSETATQPAL